MIGLVVMLTVDLMIVIQFLIAYRKKFRAPKYIALFVIAFCTVMGFCWSSLGPILIASMLLVAPPIVLLIRLADAAERQKHIFLTLVQMLVSLPSIICLLVLWSVQRSGIL